MVPQQGRRRAEVQTQFGKGLLRVPALHLVFKICRPVKIKEASLGM